MSLFNRPLADSLIRLQEQAPLLTVVVPTFSRPAEMALAVASIADQIDASLEGKIEIIISDNASGPETQAVLTGLASAYPCVNFYVHAENHGGPYQILSAPHRARGRWTWVFGDDDALEKGGLRAIVDILEKEQPCFLTVNRQVWNKSLDKRLAGSRHDLPDVRFETFLDLLALFGFDQLSFLTSQVYATDVARALDPTTYLQSPCRYSQLAYYMEAFHDRSAYYLSVPAVLHRWDPDAVAVHAANFHHLATLLPELVHLAAERVGLAPGLFERIAGRRGLLGPETRRITFVDNILENLWRSVALGTTIPEVEWAVLHQLSSQWRPGRTLDLEEVHDAYVKIDNAAQYHQALVADHKACASAGQAYSPAEIDMIQQLEATIVSLRGNVYEARKMAGEMAARFN